MQEDGLGSAGMGDHGQPLSLAATHTEAEPCGGDVLVSKHLH